MLQENYAIRPFQQDEVENIEVKCTIRNHQIAPYNEPIAQSQADSEVQKQINRETQEGRSDRIYEKAKSHNHIKNHVSLYGRNIEHIFSVKIVCDKQDAEHVQAYCKYQSSDVFLEVSQRQQRTGDKIYFNEDVKTGNYSFAEIVKDEFVSNPNQNTNRQNQNSFEGVEQRNNHQRCYITLTNCHEKPLNRLFQVVLGQKCVSDK